MSRHHSQSRGWAKLRLQILREFPLCIICHKAGKLVSAVEVDHIIPLHKGGTNDRTNLQGLCRECHKIKTALEQGYDTRLPTDLRGMPTDPRHHWNR